MSQPVLSRANLGDRLVGRVPAVAESRRTRRAAAGQAIRPTTGRFQADEGRRRRRYGRRWCGVRWRATGCRRGGWLVYSSMLRAEQGRGRCARSGLSCRGTNGSRKVPEQERSSAWPILARRAGSSGSEAAEVVSRRSRRRNATLPVQVRRTRSAATIPRVACRRAVTTTVTPGAGITGGPAAARPWNLREQLARQQGPAAALRCRRGRSGSPDRDVGRRVADRAGPDLGVAADLEAGDSGTSSDAVAGRRRGRRKRGFDARASQRGGPAGAGRQRPGTAGASGGAGARRPGHRAAPGGRGVATAPSIGAGGHPGQLALPLGL